ncbi:MAG: hypothetical protein HRT73_09005 [Flavobacteriales bacterium]|nr:hypothetical protein [Flavobacteriales bacterium]
MKTIILVVAILGSGLVNNIMAKGNLNIKEKLKKVVKFENNKLPIENNKTEFVRVSFKIDVAGKVEVLAANYSNKIMKQVLMEKLAEIKVDESHNPEKVYNYKFTFKKM